MKKTFFGGVFSQEGKPQADEQLSPTGKAPYEAPVTIRTLVETEGSFCGSVIEDNKDGSTVNTSTHDVQIDHYTDNNGDGKLENPFDFTEDGWDN